jgi:hypothetical protein
MFKILFAALACFAVSATYAQPGWVRTNYISSTIFTGVVSLGGKPVPAGSYVGAFAGQECRMSSQVIIANDSSFVSAVIHGDKPEPITFKLWLPDGQELSLGTEINTKPGESILMAPLGFSNPATGKKRKN